MTGNCGLPEGVVHAHVERCYEAGRRDERAVVQEALAKAWHEGHMTHRRLGPDNCKCEAWNESECGCGEYGANVITPNPYVTTTHPSPSERDQEASDE